MMESLWQSHKTLGRAVAHKHLIVSILPKPPCRQKGARSTRDAIDYQYVMRHKKSVSLILHEGFVGGEFGRRDREDGLV